MRAGSEKEVGADKSPNAFGQSVFLSVDGWAKHNAYYLFLFLQPGQIKIITISQTIKKKRALHLSMDSGGPYWVHTAYRLSSGGTSLANKRIKFRLVD